MNRVCHCCLLLLLLFPLQASGLERFDIITTAEMKTMLEQREEGQVDFLLVNSLDKIIYNHAAIPGSINIPLSRQDEYVGLLGADRNRLLVVH